MKLLKAGMAFIIASSVLFLSMSCSRSAETAKAVTRTAAVERGDIAVSITGTGNLAYSKTEELAFEMDGYVEEVMVTEGDSVARGDEIARLNTSDWEADIKNLTKALNKSQRSLTSARQKVTQAQRSVVSARTAVTKAQRAVAAKEIAVQSAELALKNLEYELSQMDVIKTAQETADRIKITLGIYTEMRAAGDLSVTAGFLTKKQAEYDAALAQVENIKRGLDTSLSASEALQLSKYRLNIEQARKNISDAGLAVADANKAVADARLDETDAGKKVSNAQLDLADAEQSVRDAQANLDETQSLSPIIKAPFDGFITDIKVSGGAEVYKGKVAAVIADPKQFEADILVTENDIFSVKVGSAATVSMDALSDITYPAKITFISPTAKVSSGVVNYSVTVELTSLEPVRTAARPFGQFPGGSGFSGMMPSGTPPSGGFMGTPRSGGRQQGSAQGTPPQGTAPQGSALAIPQDGTRGTFPGAAGLIPVAAAVKTISLKEGLSATVKIVTEQAANVLLVPSRAISTKNKEKTVQVVSGTATETRPVTVGMSDGTKTEVKSGLVEGDQVTYKVNTSSGTASANTNQRGMGIGVGGGQIRIR
jgi:HlyD family secretion protein